MDYRRASTKQLAYIASLCDQLGQTNPTLYTKYSLDRATKLIKSLKRKLDKQRAVDNQTRLF